MCQVTTVKRGQVLFMSIGVPTDLAECTSIVEVVETIYNSIASSWHHFRLSVSHTGNRYPAVFRGRRTFGGSCLT